MSFLPSTWVFTTMPWIKDNNTFFYCATRLFMNLCTIYAHNLYHRLPLLLPKNLKSNVLKSFCLSITLLTMSKYRMLIHAYLNCQPSLSPSSQTYSPLSSRYRIRCWRWVFIFHCCRTFFHNIPR